MNYLVAGVEDWNREQFENERPTVSGQWYYVDDPIRLERQVLAVQPKYIFFIHWRWKVPPLITDQYECICFHMTDLPYGRGGSPLQNLIQRGFRETQLTALRMTQELDSGPIYMKRSLSLDGSAGEIYKRMSRLAWQMIREMIAQEPTPRPQVGEPTLFSRRTPEQSAIPADLSLAALHDFVRMLDAPGYPHAFITTRGYRLELAESTLDGDHLVARVRITRSNEDVND